MINQIGHKPDEPTLCEWYHLIIIETSRFDDWFGIQKSLENQRFSRESKILECGIKTAHRKKTILDPVLPDTCLYLQKRQRRLNTDIKGRAILPADFSTVLRLRPGLSKNTEMTAFGQALQYRYFYTRLTEFNQVPIRSACTRLCNKMKKPPVKEVFESKTAVSRDSFTTSDSGRMPCWHLPSCGCLLSSCRRNRCC